MARCDFQRVRQPFLDPLTHNQAIDYEIELPHRADVEVSFIPKLAHLPIDHDSGKTLASKSTQEFFNIGPGR